MGQKSKTSSVFNIRSRLVWSWIVYFWHTSDTMCVCVCVCGVCVCVGVCVGMWCVCVGGCVCGCVCVCVCVCGVCVCVCVGGCVCECVCMWCVCIVWCVYVWCVCLRVCRQYHLLPQVAKYTSRGKTTVKILELRWSSWGQITMHITVTLYWGYLSVLWLFHLVCILYCGCFNLFHNVWVCVLWLFW